MPYQVDWVIEDDNDTFESGTSMLELIAKDHGLICTHSGIWLLGTKKRDMEFELKSDTGESDQEVMDRIEQIEAAFEKLNVGVETLRQAIFELDGDGPLDLAFLLLN